jgi:hypothetical protein
MSDHPDPLKAALWWVGLGAKVFPVWGTKPDGNCMCPKGEACEPRDRGKHPASPHGFKDATDDPKRIEKFLSNPGTPSYGVRLKPGWGGFDVDGEGKEKWDDLQKTLGPLPVTLTIRTANGFHYIFDWGDDPVPPNLHGFIVRSWEKGYLMGIGSRHASGVYYDAVRPLAQVAPLPLAWRGQQTLGTNGLGGNATITVGGAPEPETIEAGQGRHDYIRDRGRYYFGLGLRGGKPGGVLYAACDAYNQRFPEPLSPERMERAIDEAGLLTKFETDRGIPPTVEQVEEQVAAQTASLQTLHSLPYGTPPLPLVLDTFLAPEGWTVFYANGGTGKGLLALWMMRFVLLDPEARIAVLDYEGHRWEWGNRARAIGWTDDELKRVIYIDPYDPVWTKGHTLSGIAPEMRRVGDDQNVVLYVVDSYTTAAGSDTDMGGVKGAVDFFKAGTALGKPGLVLAHTSASDERFPAKPFGSSFVHNLARETWAGAQVGAETGLLVKGQFGVTASSIQVELRNKKRSVGARTTASQLFDIEFRSTGAIRIDYTQNYLRPLRDLIADVLTGSSGPMTAKAISAAIKEDYEREVDETTITRTLARGIDGVGEVGAKRPKTYGEVQDE